MNANRLRPAAAQFPEGLAPPPALSSACDLPVSNAAGRGRASSGEFIPQRLRAHRARRHRHRHLQAHRIRAGPLHGHRHDARRRARRRLGADPRRVGAGRSPRSTATSPSARCRAPAARPPWRIPGISFARPAPRRARDAGRGRRRGMGRRCPRAITIENGVVGQPAGKPARFGELGRAGRR